MLLILMALVTAQATPPTAQPVNKPYVASGPNVPGVPAGDQRRAARALQRLAQCFVDDYPRLAASIVDPPLSNTSNFRAELIENAREEMGRCLTVTRNGGQMITSDIVLLGAFAEQLYRRRFRELPSLGEMHLDPITHPDQVAIHTTFVFANCIIDRDAAAVDRLVRTTAGSNDEEAVLRALSPYYSGCLDVGSTLAVNRLSLRTSLADQLYRRALAHGLPSPTNQVQQ